MVVVLHHHGKHLVHRIVHHVMMIVHGRVQVVRQVHMIQVHQAHMIQEVHQAHMIQEAHQVAQVTGDLDVRERYFFR